jgi:hypothetical protein
VLIRQTGDRRGHYTVYRDNAPRTWRAAELVRFLLERDVPIWFGASDDQPDVVISFGPLAPEGMAELRKRFPVQEG